ncbi:MAG: hypothetical protein AAB724_03075 [Patescibacteria group bacterium]
MAESAGWLAVGVFWLSAGSVFILMLRAAWQQRKPTGYFWLGFSFLLMITLGLFVGAVIFFDMFFV